MTWIVNDPHALRHFSGEIRARPQRLPEFSGFENLGHEHLRLTAGLLDYLRPVLPLRLIPSLSEGDFPAVELNLSQFNQIMMSSVSLETIHKELMSLHERVERIEELIEERLIGVDEPMADETILIKEYIKSKENKNLQLLPLKEVERMSR